MSREKTERITHWFEPQPGNTFESVDQEGNNVEVEARNYPKSLETFEQWSVLPKVPDKRSGTGKAGENVSADASLRVTAGIHRVF